MAIKSLVRRLKIIRGQLTGLINLIEKKEDCRKVTEQFYAINVALKRTLEIYFKDNLTTCLSNIKNNQKKTINFLIKEIIKNK